MGALRKAASAALAADEATIAYLRRRIRLLERQLERATIRKDECLQAWYEGAKAGLENAVLSPVEPPEPDPRSGSEQVAILDISDEQNGKRTKNYNLRIAASRYDQLFERVREIVRLHQQLHPVRELHIHFNGDHNEGETVHPKQHWEIEVPLIEQIAFTSQQHGQLIRRLAGVVERVECTNVLDNHGRFGDKAGQHHERTNSAILTALQAHLLTKDLPNVRWQVGKDDRKRGLPVNSQWYWIDRITVNGRVWPCFLFHGHDVKSRRAVVKRVEQWSRVFSFKSAHHGHFHSLALEYTSDGIPIFSNGTLESGNEYALRELGAAGRPCQWLLFTNGKRITALYPIELE